MAGSSTNEARHEVISALLQAEGPLTCRQLSERCEVSGGIAAGLLGELRDDGLVAEGRWSGSAPQYRWAARWHEELSRQTARTKRELWERVQAANSIAADVFGEAARIFSEYVVGEYRPPADKRLLVFLQCSVGRPFGGTSSHGSMRRAISVATGYDAWREFEACPVHVVVLASEVGPVPYELQDIPPANISSVGVKQFGRERYARARPVLAARLAAYLRAHGGNYDRIATFTEGRYGEVMQDVHSAAGPQPKGKTASTQMNADIRRWTQITAGLTRGGLPRTALGRPPCESHRPPSAGSGQAFGGERGDLFASRSDEGGTKSCAKNKGLRARNGTT